ncbi:MAG: hypothetical protein V1494_06025 [Candidatus Diapherotrites archaeon]
MASGFIVPQLNGKASSTRDKVISLLSNEWPLSARKIHNALAKGNGFSSSYQATHKIISQLVLDGVLEKSEKNYSLNRKWIEELKNASHSIHSAYFDKKASPSFSESSFSFESMHEADKFILDFFVTNYPGDGEAIAWQWQHYWLPLFLSMKEYEKLKLIPKTAKIYSIVKGSNVIDKWCSEFWNKQGFSSKSGVNYGDNDIIAMGDLVLQAFYPKSLMKEINGFFSKTKNIQDLDVKHLFDNIFLKKTQIPIIIAKNPALAKQIKENVQKHFEGGRKQ